MKQNRRPILGAGFLSALAFCAALVFAFALSACSSEKKEDSSSIKTVSDIHNHILTLAEFPEMEEMDGESVSELYGIELQNIKEHKVYFSSNAVLADEIAVFELSDEGYRSELVNLLKQRLKSAANIAKNYSPEQYEIIIKSTVEEKGSFVFYVVNAKSESIVSEIKKLIAG